MAEVFLKTEPNSTTDVPPPLIEEGVVTDGYSVSESGLRTDAGHQPPATGQMSPTTKRKEAPQGSQGIDGPRKTAAVFRKGKEVEHKSTLPEVHDDDLSEENRKDDTENRSVPEK